MNAHLDMTLRDWFAGMAMQQWGTPVDDEHRELIAYKCYLMADAMLAEREAHNG